jgi:hypothetical protein
MKTRFVLTGLLLSVMLFGLGACVKKDEPVKNEPVSGYRILVVTGGHEFDEKEFFEMVDAIPGITYDKAVMPRDMGLLAPGLEKKYDAILCYAQNHFYEAKERRITDRQRANYGKLLQNGMPLLVLHHSVGSFPKWPAYREIAGGAYIFSGAVPLYENLDGKSWPASDYEHDVEMNITVVDKDHPITQGVDDFVIHDEAYIGVYVSPNVHVLLTTSYPGATPEVAWVHRYGNSPVFTLTLGHDKHANDNENLRKLIAQGLDWLISERKTTSL